MQERGCNQLIWSLSIIKPSRHQPPLFQCKQNVRLSSHLTTNSKCDAKSYGLRFPDFQNMLLFVGSIRRSACNHAPSLHWRSKVHPHHLSFQSAHATTFALNRYIQHQQYSSDGAQPRLKTSLLISPHPHLKRVPFEQKSSCLIQALLSQQSGNFPCIQFSDAEIGARTPNAFSQK